MSASSDSQPVETIFSSPNIYLYILLLASIVRLWLMLLGSSFWVDELLTAFVVHHGTAHPSLSVAPQVTASIYYFLPRASESLFGFSEIAFRLPSIIAMAVALFFTGRLAARLIHPHAAWFAVFASLGLSGINYQAADARPYALGTCIAAASFWFLVRWLDKGDWPNGFAFLLSAGLLWRVHLIYWPLYAVFALYTCVRVARRDTQVGWLRATSVFTLLGLILLPVLISALDILPRASEHAFAPLPGFRELLNALKVGLIVVCGVGAWLLSRWYAVPPPNSPARDEAPRPSDRWSAIVLIAGWWLLHPLLLFAYSRLSGNSVFLYRYLSVSLLGGVLMAVFVGGIFMPAARWRQAAALLGVGVFLLMGQWRTQWPNHDISDWRGAANQVHELALAPDTPVICPSPFLEARPPVWNSTYELPGFLYAHLDGYPLAGKQFLFPFEPSPEAAQYATALTRETLATADRFLIYGGDRNVSYWRNWFASRPEFSGWKKNTYREFGNVWVVIFERDGQPQLPVPQQLPGIDSPGLDKRGGEEAK